MSPATVSGEFREDKNHFLNTRFAGCRVAIRAVSHYSPRPSPCSQESGGRSYSFATGHLSVCI